MSLFPPLQLQWGCTGMNWAGNELVLGWRRAALGCTGMH